MNRTLPLMGRAARCLALLVAGFACLVIPASAGAQFGKAASPAEATLYGRVVDEAIQLALEIEIDDHWHLYHYELGDPHAVGKPTRVSVDGEGVQWSGAWFPVPVRAVQPFMAPGGGDASILQHEGTVVIYLAGRPESGTNAAAALGELTVDVDGLVCEDMEHGGVCIPYAESALEIEGEGAAELWADFPAALRSSAAADFVRPGVYGSGGVSAAAPAADGAAPVDGEGEGASSREFAGGTGDTKGAEAGSAASDAGEAAGDLSLFAFLLLAVGGGLFTLLMPCTYPMIPITISFFTKQADERDGSVLPLSLCYGIGIVAIFVLIGVTVGEGILLFAAHPVTNLVIGLLFVVFALSLFGMINLQPPRFLLNAAGAASMRGGYLGVFLMGATLVVTSFTCTAPFVGSLLSLGAQGSSASTARIALGMGVFGLTMAVPFVALSILPGSVKAMPKSGQWMNVLKVTLGFVELAAALKFISNSDLTWNWGFLSREVFLLAWTGLFLICAAFLFGKIDLKGETGGAVGPGRMVAGIAFVLFGLYCFGGVLGLRLDKLMLAIAPPYSSWSEGVSALRGGGAGHEREFLKDDYEGALALARAEGKTLLVNFTGFT